ncbi:hypothetical protein [Benzoatithermus flavus]|uniref:Uncharacterized protein n=1 Tax=Benzoatithermus flavus TaxID=3108223 RepID=A0ABU8XLT4_9PROT
MSVWNLLEYAAWAASALIFLWMVLDAVRVSRDYSEDVLLSSREGEVELADELEARRD